MKRVAVLLLIFALLFCGTALAGTTSSEGDIEFEFKSNCSITRVQSIKFAVTKRAGNPETSYTDESTDWSLISEGRFQIEGEANKPVSVQCQDSVVVSNGKSSAKVTLKCRADQNNYPGKDDGQSCSDAGLELSSDGKMYISVFPVAVSLDSPDATGTYRGTFTITVDY